MDFGRFTRTEKMEEMVLQLIFLEAFLIQKIEKQREKVLLLMILRSSGKEAR
jgi:hypothetical protein